MVADTPGQCFMDCQWAKVTQGKNGARFVCAKGHSLPNGLSVNGMLYRDAPLKCLGCQVCPDFLSVETWWSLHSRLLATAEK